MPLIVNVVGARPNFVKMAPVVKEMNRRGIKQILVHTGQHYDANMSDVFFRDLNFPKPDANFNVGSGSHASQTADIMKAFEQLCLEKKPSLVVVAGDVNSTAACALTAAKLGISVAHVEAGLRSFDRTMPEEINRVVADHLSDLLFVTEPSGRANLLREGIDAGKIFDVGNSMIDSLLEARTKAQELCAWTRFGFKEFGYVVLTLHRPENVDHGNVLIEISRAVQHLAARIPVIFPVHPRTLKNMSSQGASWTGVTLTEPLGYLEFLSLTAKAALVMTDSGGLQEETTVLGIPCMTLRKNTERPITVTQGTNRLVAANFSEITRIAEMILKARTAAPNLIPLWDGRSAQRITDVIEDFMKQGRSPGERL